MDKIARTDWKRHSAPYDYNFDFTVYNSSVDAVVDQAMQAFTADTGQQKTSTIGRDRKKNTCVVEPEKTELSTDQYTPGVLKVFGETIFPGVQYKSVLASCRSTAQELVREALERFGLPAEDNERFVLCDVVGRYEHDICESRDTEVDVPKFDKWDRVFTRMLADRDKPLLLQKFWKPIDGYSRRYELHERAHVTDVTDDDDTSGLNQNARKILISKLRPGAIPLFDASSVDRDSDGLKLNVNIVNNSCGKRMANLGSNVTNGNTQAKKVCSAEQDSAIPSKHPFFVNIRGFDVEKDRTVYIIKSKRFTFGNPNLRNHHAVADDTPKFSLFAPDIEPIHCNVKVYKFKKSNGVSDSVNDRNNYFLELEPLEENVCVNGHKIHGKILVKSGDIINIGIYYVLLFKDCSKGNDIPLSLPWLPVPDMSDDNEVDNSDLKLNLANGEDESNSNTDESVDASIAERMYFAYTKEKEEELVKYICAIIQQQNTCKTYSLTVTFLFSMCIEHASRKFDRRQLKHLFLRILFTVRENVAETAKSLSACKFSCTLLDASLPPSDRDRKLERLLLWISNCVQLLLFLKHTFQLPELPLSDRGSARGRDEKASRKEENAKHALGQLVTGLEEIIMFCFQQCVYTITKALHPVLPALLDSNPFSDANSEQCSMEDVIRMFERLAEVTHSVMLHEGITRQLFTYLFFFTNTNIFNKLIVDESGVRYYNWQCGVRVRANLSQLEDWATQNGLEDEFSQMFERLLAMSELLATSKNTLVKYQWPMMKTHYQPLSAGQLHHILSHYQMGGKATPVIWTPSQEEMEQIREEDIQQLPLSNHPPFALPDNCGVVDLIRSPEDTSFWNHLRRLKSLYGVTEDDSDSGFSISNTPRGSCSATTKSDIVEPFFEQEIKEIADDDNMTSERRASYPESSLMILLQKQKNKIPIKKCITNPWSFKVPKQGTGVCNCANVPADELATSGTLASDLMKEERREQPEANEHSKDPREIKAVSAKSSESRAQNNTQVICKTELKNLVQRYQKSLPSGNVADCSARTLPKSLQIKERNKLKQLQSRISQAHSFSVDDLPLRLMKHRPSASFEEAIERGYTSDTYHCKSASISEAEEDTIAKEETKEVKATVRTRVPRNGIRRHKSLITDSVSSDEVFHSENNIDTLYKDYLSDINAQPLPNKLSFKPISTSVKPKLKLRTNVQKMTSVSFEPESRRSSIELTKDDLFINNANLLKSASTGMTEDDADDMFEPETNEAFPGELFTEVNESTLAALKRHGSSLNVAPSSENSPRTVSYEQVSEVLGPDEQKRMSPCPLFTVYLKRGDTGLGLGLIDGLHTPLRLAGIYIRKILPNSPAALNGCLQIGDRVLAVDGKSVIGASYQSTMNAIKDAGETLTLLVARGNESMASKVCVSQV